MYDSLLFINHTCTRFVLLVLLITRKQKITANRTIHILDLRLVVWKKTESPYAHVCLQVKLFVPNYMILYKLVQFPLSCSRDIHYFVKKIRHDFVANFIRQAE